MRRPGSAPGAAAFDFLTWGLDAVGAPQAWADGNTGAGVRVAVLDAGIDPRHPDLAPNLNTDLSASFVPCVVANCVDAVEDWRITPGFYFNDVLTDLTLEDIFSGIGKSFFFAFWITIVGCYNGLTARGGADGVGRATTNTVVVSAILVLVTDFFLTKLFHLLA